MKRKVRRTILRLLVMNNTPQEIALGTAIGVFIAILPLYGFHTLLVLIAALLVRRANKIAILAGTNISLPPTLPFITWAGYEIGRFILGGKLPPLRWVDFKGITFQKILDFYPPLLLGSFFLAIICAAVFYVITFFVVKMIRERREHARRVRHQHKEVRG